MDREDRLADLLVAWEDAAAAGAPAYPADLCRDCPDLLPAFRALLADLAPVNAVLGGPGAGPGIGFDAGRYRPVRFHASGGLGEVFAAADAELRRTVALKRMQGLAALDAAARRRFLREAEITGRLEHPGVVPVYGLGRDSDGRPFYAMRFVHGRTLGDEVDRFHGRSGPPEPADPAERNVGFRRLVRGLVSICQTVAYAHDRGVVHRDLKPANVMVGEYGETLVVDWGLAKYVGRPAPEPAAEASTDAEPLPTDTGGAADPTAAGSVLGTPAYMSPEQARAEEVGPAGDVYSLGATLFTLLTGRRPHDGAATPEVLRRARAGVFDPPRRVAPGVPGPLDAVCRKATAADPAGRYATAGELARDLERWLADEPVTAWREPVAVRARRWVKRHRLVVTAAAVALVVGAAGLAALVGLERRRNEQLRRANADLVAANERVERNYTRARQAARAMAEYALNDPEFRGGGGRVVLPEDVVTSAETEARLREARDTLRALLEDRPDDPDNQSDLAAVCANLGQVLEARGHREDALRAFAEARQLRAADPAARLSLALIDLAEARLHLKAGDFRRAEGFAEKAGLAFERAGDGDNPRYALASARGVVGLARYHQNRPAEAIPPLEQSAAALAEFVGREPRNPNYAADRAGCDFYLGVAYSERGSGAARAGRPDEAVAGLSGPRDLTGTWRREEHLLRADGRPLSVAYTLAFQKAGPDGWGRYTAAFRDASGRTEEARGRYRFEEVRLAGNGLSVPAYAPQALVLESDNDRYEVAVLAGTGADELTVATDLTDYFVWRMATAVVAKPELRPDFDAAGRVPLSPVEVRKRGAGPPAGRAPREDLRERTIGYTAVEPVVVTLGRVQ